MLEDFIKVHELNSKVIVSGEEIRKVSVLSKLTGLSLDQCFKTTVFLDESENVWICVFPWKKKLNEEKVRQAVPIFSDFIEGQEVEEITGYADRLVPPISVYDARLLIDSSLKDFDKICTITEKQTMVLVLELKELPELIDEIVFAEIT
ncbi:MAG: YbaK/EbsC family protein [Candidatus Diapherotrites archaeon]